MESWNKLQNRFEINILPYVRANTTEYTPRENLTLGFLYRVHCMERVSFILFVDYKVTYYTGPLTFPDMIYKCCK